MKLTGIVAMTPERVIGKDNDMPWHLPEDLKMFKATTKGHPIVMGRKTWDSIGRPLPGRQNIVLTRNTEWSADGAEVINEPDDLSRLTLQDEHVFIIGGAQVYEMFLPYLDGLYVSHVFDSPAGDTYFPEFEQYFSGYDVVEVFDDFELRLYKK